MWSGGKSRHTVTKCCICYKKYLIYASYVSSRLNCSNLQRHLTETDVAVVVMNERLYIGLHKQYPVARCRLTANPVRSYSNRTQKVNCVGFRSHGATFMYVYDVAVARIIIHRRPWKRDALFSPITRDFSFLTKLYNCIAKFDYCYKDVVCLSSSVCDRCV